MVLHVDKEVQGYNREIEDVTDMKVAVVSLIDENVIEVTVKKRATKCSSPVKCQNFS